MEVTRENFDAVLSRLKKDFENAQFIAIDTEFTGLRVEGATNINYFDVLEDLYLKNREKAETFMAIQIGFAIFFCVEGSNKYSHLGYNFYVYPSSHSDINFTCQSKSIQFLSDYGFDYNKLFKSGVPYLKSEEAEKLIGKITEKYEKHFTCENPTKMEIPNEHRKTVCDIKNKIQDILNSNKKITFTTEKYYRYVRRLIYNSVQLEFGSKVYLESNKDDTMTISVGFSSEEVKEKQKEKFNEQKKEILNEIGFSKVIKLLIESKKLLVGHNLFVDILFIIRQFLVPLPRSYIEFKELVKFIFPSIIDTKYMAAVELKDIKSTSLNCVAEYLKNVEAFPEAEALENGMGYNIGDCKLHEASFDAYLTGLCFLGMAKYSGKTNIYEDLTKSPFLESFLNKLSIPKLYDINCMNLGGLDNKPDRCGVYHLTFPKEWTQDNITQLFKNCGFIKISWINTTSAFIKVKTEYIKEVESLIDSGQNYKLLTYNKFKNSNSNPDVKLSSMEGTEVQNFANADSHIEVDFNDSIKKRKAEEDIGEVIERPQKKYCSN